MTTRFVGVRAVLQRGDPTRPVTHGSDADRLAATLAHFWAESSGREMLLAVFAATGEITDATVAALRRDLTLLEQAAGGPAGQAGSTREWTTQTVVGCLLAYAQAHNPRGPVAGWVELRNPATAARLFARSAVPVQEPSAMPDQHPSEPTEPAVEVNLFEALGAITGLPPAKAVGLAVEALYARLFEDRALVGTFRPPLASVDFTAPEHRPRLQAHMRAFLTAALGGPRRYQGRGMTEAHARLGITDDQFTGVLSHAVHVLDGLGVPPDAVGAVGGKLALLRTQIVTA